jgi:hypothetical protein
MKTASRLPLACLVAALFVSNLAAASPIPDTAVGKRFAAFLADFNARRTGETRWERWYSAYGPLEVVLVEDATETKARIWTRGVITRGVLGS